MNISKYDPTKIFEYPCESHVSCYPLYIELSPGAYFIQCYGASGGDSGNAKGGYGAYVSGLLHLKEKKTFHIYIGAEGHLDIGKTSYNGGGRGQSGTNNEKSKGASGGGCTDIRLLNKTDIDGLLSRIIVAGGGGGADSYSNGAKGGDAGSFEGENGYLAKRTDLPSEINVALGATQISGGIGSKCIKDKNGNKCPPNYDGKNGTFGPDYQYGAGGGGGYFGGGGGGVTYDQVTSGAGGSSYISGKRGCHSYQKGSDNSIQNIHSSIHSSNLYFTSITFLNGTQSKYKGNGKVIITLMNIELTCKYMKNQYIGSLHLFILVFIKN